MNNYFIIEEKGKIRKHKPSELLKEFEEYSKKYHFSGATNWGLDFIYIFKGGEENGLYTKKNREG